MKNNRTGRMIFTVIPFVLAALLALAGCSRTSRNATQNPAPEVQAATEQSASSDEGLKEDKTEKKAVLTRTPKDEREKDTQEPEKEKRADREEKGSEKDKTQITEDGYYYDLESVVLYYDMFGKLPSNYITKNEAKKLGWEGGALEPFMKDGAIGGDRFGNYENSLPGGKNTKYIECDIDTHRKKRGAKRLIISQDGKYYYTNDHYGSFRQVVVTDGEVQSADGTRL